MGFELVQLPSVRVACYRYEGDDEQPQNRAMDGLLRWAKAQGLLPPVVDFYLAFLADRPLGEGIEAWLPVEGALVPRDGVAVKQTPGGLYALRKGGQPWGEGLDDAEADFGANLGPWLDANGYVYDADRQLLHEHLVAANVVGRPFREDPGFRIDIYLPLRPQV